MRATLSSGFANTDLDLLLKRHGIQRVIVMGLIARVRGGDGPLCRGPRLRGHNGEGCDCGLLR
jgi:hypothetical protein